MNEQAKWFERGDIVRLEVGYDLCVFVAKDGPPYKIYVQVYPRSYDSRAHLIGSESTVEGAKEWATKWLSNVGREIVEGLNLTGDMRDEIARLKAQLAEIKAIAVNYYDDSPGYGYEDILGVIEPPQGPDLELDEIIRRAIADGMKPDEEET